MTRRVVVTGMGVVSPIGVGLAAFWDGLSSGKCGIVSRAYNLEELKLTVPSAPVDGQEDAIAELGRDISRSDRVTKLAVLAADQAIGQSGLEIDDALSPRAACIIGTGIGGQETINKCYGDMLLKGRKAHPLSILKIIPNAPASHISIRHGLRGASFAISSACASATHSIGVCADLIKNGSADVGLAGATEAILTYSGLEAWRSMHILASETCRPFSKNRNGLVIGEGAGILVLEEEEHAKKRGATILARLAGFGMNSDGNDMINPSAEGAAGAIKLAMDGVKISNPSAVYVNAHGTGTLMNDPTETKAIRSVFESDADELIVSSTKSMHGHLLGAAGGIEAIAAILAMRNNLVPPTINYEEPDPACDLNYAPNEPVERALDLSISNSFAFGGLNAVVSFEKV